MRVRPAVTGFRLARPALVHVRVWQQAPTCALLGGYTLRAPRGRNVLHLHKRIGTHRLLVGGTYHVVGKALGVRVVDVRVRLTRVRGHLQVRRTGLENTCAAVEKTTLDLLGSGFNPSTAASFTPPPKQPVVRGHGGATPSAAGAQPSTPGNGPLATPTSRAILFVLLGIAVTLLASAALPGEAAVGGAVARHRAALTSAGITLTVAAALVLLLT